MYQIITYIPELVCDNVTQAMFNAGAGRYENYEQCCWKVLGQGQFKPLSGSLPFIGNQNQLEFVKEYRVEMICDEHHLKAAIAALKNTHPYEEPAYTVLQHITVK